MMDSLPLGKHQDFPETYDPKQLYRIPRAIGRSALHLNATAFYGYDLWRVYELSWLDNQGKPCVAALEIKIPAESDYLVESKSLKLYLGSLNQTTFSSPEKLLGTIQLDLENLLESPVVLQLFPIAQTLWSSTSAAWEQCIDDQALDHWQYDYSADLLQCADSKTTVKENLVSHLLRSLCPVTGQPDWASIIIQYSGTAICHAALLRYIVSFRKHAEFHEQCVERIFWDILQQCGPQQLSVYAAYTRRGGIEINPFRSTESSSFVIGRAARQ